MNEIEHEARILDVNPVEIRERLRKIGAQKIVTHNFKRYVFDTIPAQKNRWIRLRSDGERTTLTVKEIEKSSIDGTREWEILVSNFDETLKILEKIGVKPRGYQENIREEFQFDGAEITIDFWPKLNPYIEIEAKDSAKIYEIAQKLGFSKNDLTAKDNKTIYAENGIDLDKIEKLDFDKETKK